MIRRFFPAVAIVVLAISPAASQPAPRQVELADYYRVESISDTAVSPDGRSVAFVRTFIVEAENRRQSEILDRPRRRLGAAASPHQPGQHVVGSAVEPRRPAAGVHVAAGRHRARGAGDRLGMVPAHGRRRRRGVPHPRRGGRADLQPRQQVDRLHQAGAAGDAAARRDADAVREVHRRSLHRPHLRLDERALRRPRLPRGSS